MPQAAPRVAPRWPAAAPVAAEPPLVGRVAELDELGRLVGERRASLVTLVGIGGVGKSRLATELAWRELDRFGGRVAVVPLDGVTDPSLVLPAIAGALGIPDEPGRPLAERLAEELGRRPTLLVLDTVEHLRAAGPLLAELLARAPSVVAVATSRVALGIPRERVTWVEPLPVPVAGDPADAVAASPAVALFLAHARTARPDLDTTPQTLATIAEICRRLDGIPLAIELAAAAVRVLAPHQLLDQLGDRLAHEAAGDGDRPERRRSLRAAMDWSVGLLSPPAARLYRRLAVFAGPFDLDAVAAVLDGADRRGLLPVDAPLDELLAELSASSLVRRAEGQRPGWVLLSTVRADALDRLEQAGEAVAMRWAHAYHLLGLAESLERDLPTEREIEALDRLDAAHDDLREAFEWAAERGEHAFCVRLAGALAEFWRTRGHLTEGRLRLVTALASAPDAPPPARRKALAGAGLLASYQGDYALGESYLREALAVARSEGDRDGMAVVLTWLGTNAYGAGTLDVAEAYVGEALALRRELGDEPGIAVALNALGGVAHFRGDLDRALAMFRESLEIKRRHGNANAIAVALTNIGLVERDAGRPASASDAFSQAISIWERSGDRQRLAVGLHNAALVALDGGDPDTAVALLERAYATARELGDRTGMAYTRADRIRAEVERGGLAAAAEAMAESLPRAVHLGSRVIIPLALEGAGSLAAALGRDEQAVRLWGAAAAERASSGFANMPADRRLLERHQAAPRARLGEADWRAALDAGTGLALADAVAEALSLRDVAQPPAV